MFKANGFHVRMDTGQERVVHFEKLIQEEERFLISNFFYRNLTTEDNFDEDKQCICEGTFIKWRLSSISTESIK